MNRHPAWSAPVLLGLAVILTLATPAAAGDFLSQTNFGSSFFSASPSCPAKRIPTLETVAPIPSIFDAMTLEDAIFTCFIDVENGGEGVKGVRGRYNTQLIVRHNDTGLLDTFDIDSGSFKTNRRGQDSFDFDIPSELFADGFESGDVSAWSYTRTDFSNKKRVDNSSVQCGKGAARSD